MKRWCIYQTRAVILVLLQLPFLYSCDQEPTAGHEVMPISPGPVESPAVNADLIVIGAGIAGLATALEVADSRRSVLIIDMASIFGGHAVMSAGGLSIVDTPMQREKGIEDTPELAFNDFVSWGDDVNADWVRYYVDHSKSDIYDWVTGLGVEFMFIAKPHGNSVPRMHFPKNFGLGLVKPVYQAALESRFIRFNWNTRADELIIRDGGIIGVRTTNTRTKQTSELYAHALMIATGGFQSNLDRVLKNWRQDYPVPGTLLAGSGWYSQGSGLDMAGNAGAKLEHLDYMWNYIDGARDPRYPGEDRGLRVLMGNGTGIWLNEAGDRFINECLSVKDTLPAVLQQPGQSHWMVFDSVGRQTVNVAGSGWTPEKVDSEIFSNDAIMKQGDTLEELADKLSIPAENLRQSIEGFNRMVDQGTDADFGRFESTAPAGGNCAKVSKLETPPYFAVKRYPLARKSMGGIKIDIEGHVISAESGETIIPGLYASGEATGFAGINGKAGLEGTFLGPSIVTGRVGGRTIARELPDLPSAPARQLPAQPGAADSMNAANGVNIECSTCHQLSSLLASTRPGYRHFEFVHQNVLERGLDCQTCHSEMSPYLPASHKIIPEVFVESCQHCHGTGD